jgi:hypothetical protein
MSVTSYQSTRLEITDNEYLRNYQHSYTKSHVRYIYCI